MRRDSPDKRRGKRLLVASIGVATVSYLALQSGCTDLGEETFTSGNLVAPPLDASVEPVLPGDAARPADAGSDALIGSGNLLPPPADASSDALITSGNLLPPPPEGGADAAPDAVRDAAARDGQADVGLPSIGNLLPPPRPPIWIPPPPSGETD
jgi:hypothetical protein